MSYLLQIASFTLAFFLSAWLIGRGALALLGVGERGEERTATALLAAPAGIGLLVVSLFVLAALHALNAAAIAAVAGAGSLLGGVLLHRSLAARQQSAGEAFSGFIRRNRYLLLCAVLVTVPLVLRALGAPLEWDEVSYHLPYVREYINHGGLTVAEHLRFPLHSHNYQLLYAAALIFSSEAGAHLVHALSGALVALGAYFLGREFLGRNIGIIAALMYLSFAGPLMDNAYVDLGLGLFVFYAFYAFAQWRKHGNDGFLYLSAFLLAMAAGTKYQALALLPVFGLMLLAHTRSPRRLFAYALVVALFGSWWYVRNYMISGDPVHPLGGGIFGYWIWNEFDLEGVREHLSRINDSLPVYLYPALLSWVFARRQGSVYRAMVFFALSGLAFWFFTTRYERYLVPIYPFLALLSLYTVWTAISRWVPARLQNTGGEQPSASSMGPKQWVPLLLLALVSLRVGWNEFEDACFTPACIERTLTEQTATYRLWREVPAFGELRLFQYGFENEIYYLGRPLGDWRGAYRYEHVTSMGSDAAALKDYLEGLSLDALLVSKQREPFYQVLQDPEIHNYFDTLYANDQLVLLKIAQ